MEEKTVKSMNLALARPTEKAAEMNTKLSTVIRLAIAEFLNK